MTQLDLTRKLAQPITLTGGPRSHLVTLMDAAILIRDLDQFRRARPVWDRGAEMILTAAETGKRADVAEATRQLRVALDHENWARPRGPNETETPQTSEAVPAAPQVAARGTAPRRDRKCFG